MGMFDFVTVKVPIEGQIITDEFQTKNLGCMMDDYTITAAGRLIHHSVRREFVPEEERPCYGTPQWETIPLSRLFGSIRCVPTGDVDTNYHGDIYLIGEFSGHFAEYVARFTDGQLAWIRPIDAAVCR